MVPEPIYRQIADDLQRKIESGELAPGDQLPTEAELRDAHDASRNTVRDAMKWLISRGLIETRPGQGTFVLEKIDPFVTTLGLDTGLGGGETTTYLSEVRKRQRRPSNALPKIETIAPGTAVVSRLQLRYIDDRPWSMQTTFYPFALVERGATRLVLPENIEPGAVRYLENELKVKEVGWRETIIVRAPDADESDFFQLSGDGRVAVFEVRRVAFEESGKPLRVTVTTYPADRNQFAVNVGRIPEETTSPEIGSTEGNDAVPASSS
jgi:GntR family transcriptional regulator